MILLGTLKWTDEITEPYVTSFAVVDSSFTIQPQRWTGSMSN